MSELSRAVKPTRQNLRHVWLIRGRWDNKLLDGHSPEILTMISYCIWTPAHHRALFLFLSSVKALKCLQVFHDVRKSTFFFYFINFKQNADKFHATTRVTRNFNSNLEPVSNNFLKRCSGLCYRSCSVSLELWRRPQSIMMLLVDPLVQLRWFSNDEMMHNVPWNNIMEFHLMVKYF